MQSYFITGTDTDVGKTVATVLLLKSLNMHSGQTLGIKPISAGCENTDAGLRNEDALKLQAASSIKAEYEIINPIAFEPFIAPHIAAAKQNKPLRLEELDECLNTAKRLNPKWLLVEGAGGWRLPLNDNGQFYSDFAQNNQLKVILVVGLKLGCLNHAILSHQAIINDGLECVGWVANHLSSDMPNGDDNLRSLRALLPIPQLAEIPFQSSSIDTINLTDKFLQVFA